MKEAIFWGATGQARVLREALSYTDMKLVALFDNQALPSPFSDVPIHKGEDELATWLAGRGKAPPPFACVAIGGARGAERLDIQRKLDALGCVPLTVVHPRSFVATDAKLGRGCQILAMSAVCANTRLGDAVIVNTSASVDHDCVLHDGVHIGPGAHLAGEVTVEANAFIGTGAVVLPRLCIGAGATVGAGAVVTRDVAPGITVLGNPARPGSE